MIGYEAGSVARWITTVQARHRGRTDATVGADLVEASATVRAWITLALVDVELTAIALVALTLTDRACVALLAYAPVKAGVRAAVSVEGRWLGEF